MADLEHRIDVLEAQHAGGIDRRGRLRVGLQWAWARRLTAGSALSGWGTGGDGGLGGWRQRLLRREPPSLGRRGLEFQAREQADDQP